MGMLKKYQLKWEDLWKSHFLSTSGWLHKMGDLHKITSNHGDITWYNGMWYVTTINGWRAFDGCQQQGHRGGVIHTLQNLPWLDRRTGTSRSFSGKKWDFGLQNHAKLVFFVFSGKTNEFLCKKWWLNFKIPNLRFLEMGGQKHGRFSLSLM